MEKNENGYPINQSRARQNGVGNTQNGTSRNGAGNTQNDMRNGNLNGTGNAQNGTDHMHNNMGYMQNGTGNMNNGTQGDARGRTDTQGRTGNGCSGVGGTHTNGCGGDTVLDSFMPGYIYAPRQKFCMLYSARDALSHGTLFEELYKPMEVYGRE